MKILATKKLKVNQRDLILGAGFSVVDYNSIAIDFLAIDVPHSIENAIFTSKNGVLSLLKSNTHIKKCYCVGEKTKALLEENGLTVIEVAQNAKALGQSIIKKYPTCSFYYFCGNMRRDELSEILKNKHIATTEIKTYNTTLKPKKFEQHWDGILFFSPSGVKSYISANKNYNTIPAFCIGETTASLANNYFTTIVIANSHSVESVIAKAVKTLTITSN
jgi:uroporphyrinogen-III synthase